MQLTSVLSSKKPINIQRQILLISVVLALIAWFIGYFSNSSDVIPMIAEIIPNASRVEVRGNIYVALDPTGVVAGYAALGSAQGYAGPIEMLVGIDLQGNITGVKIVKQRETPGFFKLILGEGFPEQFIDHSFKDPLRLNTDIDAVSGATISAEGIAASTRQAVRLIAQQGLGSPLPPESQKIKFGYPELTLIGLYAAGYFGHKLRSSAWKKRIRWGTMLTGMIVLGFIYTAPFTIAQVISLLSGYWPDWHNNLYWYILIGGIIFVTTVDAKNPYCNWFCPFGAFQECLAQVTNAKLYRPRKWSAFFKWLQRGLAFTAVLLGLALRRPGVAGYEPFATLFDFRGNSIEVVFLVIIVLASLLMYRPFCNYLCPLDPVYDFIAESRRWVREGWMAWKKRAPRN
ncbi:MAG: FMN-binding protein [Anaerolineales bacterium]|nr:FMN-binding protein [Anaerolineales bacterium]